jgi:hypothetical protein
MVAAWRRGLGPGGQAGLSVILFIGLAAAAFGSYIFHGGFYSDDWADLARVHEHGYGAAIDLQMDSEPSRPILAVLQLLPHAVFGGNPRPDLVLALVLAILVSVCFFYLLRMLEVPALAAVTVAALVLLFPWSDSTRLWAITSINQVALLMYLVGAMIALWGLRSSGYRGALIHLFACGLFVASVFSYEATGALAMATGVLYFIRSPARKALLAWGTDIVLVGAAIGVSISINARPVQFHHSQLSSVWPLMRGAAVLTAHAAFPIVGPHTWVVVAVLVLVGAVALAAFLLRGRERFTELRRPLLVLGAAIVCIGLSYVMFIPAGYWTPQKPGLENRVNIIAALPIALFVYMLATLLALLVIPRAFRWRPRLTIGLVTLFAVALAVDYGIRLHHDEGNWRRAYAAERGVLTTLRAVLPHPAPGTTILTFGVPAQVAPRIPVFYDTWDLTSAAQITLHQPSLNAYPALESARFGCSAYGLIPILPTPSTYEFLDPKVNGQQLPLPYGHVDFVDVPGRRVLPISSQRQCLRVVGRFRPGPLESPPLLRILADRARNAPVSVFVERSDRTAS